MRQAPRPFRGEEILMKGFSRLASRIVGVVLLALVVASSSGAGSSPSRLRLHEAASMSAAVASGPLDPLSVAEISETFQVIESYGQFPRGAFFPYVGLQEPSKSSVLAGTSVRKAL